MGGSCPMLWSPPRIALGALLRAPGPAVASPPPLRSGCGGLSPWISTHRSSTLCQACAGHPDPSRLPGSWASSYPLKERGEVVNAKGKRPLSDSADGDAARPGGSPRQDCGQSHLWATAGELDGRSQNDPEVGPCEEESPMLLLPRVLNSS